MTAGLEFLIVDLAISIRHKPRLDLPLSLEVEQSLEVVEPILYSL